MTSNESSFGVNDSRRTALDPEMLNVFRARVLETSCWLRFTLVRHQKRVAGRESIRPVLIREASCWQVECVKGGRTTVRNLETHEMLGAELERLLQETGPREYHLQDTAGDLHVRVTRKGRMLVSRGRVQAKPSSQTPLPHDRIKNQPLTQFDASALLRVIGIADGSNSIRAAMRGKYDQINAFLRELELVLPRKKRSRPMELVDCGSGGAYLTLAAYFYLRDVHGLDVRVRGIDCNETLVKKANDLAHDLDVGEHVTFIADDLATCTLDSRPDLLLSLHACDDATDAALALGVVSGAEAMLVAPCCQHDLQTQIKEQGPMRALLRHGMLRERQADLLTDAFRSQILRMLGYRVKIVEFVSSEATARNLRIPDP